MHARMIHSHSGKTTPIPYGKKGQVSHSDLVPVAKQCFDTHYNYNVKYDVKLSSVF